MKGKVRYQSIRFIENSSLSTSMRVCRKREVIGLRKATWTEKGEDVSEYKPEGATHLQDEKPPDEEIEPEELLDVIAGALSARASVPDPTDQILLSPNYTPGWPAGAPAGVTIHTEEGAGTIPAQRGSGTQLALRAHISASGATVRSCSSSGSGTGLGTQGPPGCTTSALSMRGDRDSGPYRSFGRQAATRKSCATTIIC